MLVKAVVAEREGELVNTKAGWQENIMYYTSAKRVVNVVHCRRHVVEFSTSFPASLHD